jgi:hypothetical protein
MPSLTQVCVWEEFLSDHFSNYDTTGSPNVFFTTECDTKTEEWEYDDIRIYPNPTNILLIIEIGTSNHYNIEITSMKGQLMVSKEMEGTTYQVDLSFFQKGIYFITVRSRDQVWTDKIIKL